MGPGRCPCPLEDAGDVVGSFDDIENTHSAEVNPPSDGGGKPAELADSSATPTAASATNGSIVLKLFPKASSYAKDCAEIGHVQFLQMYVVFNDGSTRLIKPSELRARDAWLDPALSPQGHAVDTCMQNGSPMYQDASASTTRNGQMVIMDDTPRVAATDLRGWSTMRWQFTTYGF